jgi:hypothetical protein
MVFWRLSEAVSWSVLENLPAQKPRRFSLGKCFIPRVPFLQVSMPKITSVFGQSKSASFDLTESDVYSSDEVQVFGQTTG